MFHDHAAAEGGKDEGDAEITQLFISYRGYCARKGVSANWELPFIDVVNVRPSL